MRPILYSWILPIKDEASSLPQLFKEIKKAMKGKNYEIIAINDASKDSSLKVLISLSSLIPQLKIINFKLPQGKWKALQAGFDASKGQILITSDSDLQDNPEEFKKMIKEFYGYDLVSGFRKKRFDPWYKVFISRIGNLLASKVTGQRFKDLNSPFKVYRKEVLDVLPKYGSMLRFSNLFAKKLGYRVVEIEIDHRPRLYGKSKFGMVKYLRIIYDLILISLLFTGSGKIKNGTDTFFIKKKNK